MESRIKKFRAKDIVLCVEIMTKRISGLGVLLLCGYLKKIWKSTVVSYERSIDKPTINITVVIHT